MKNDFVIRPASLEDAEALCLIGCATFLESYAQSLPGKDILLHCQKQHSAACYRAYLQGGGKAWLAETGETATPVGYALNTQPDLPVPLAPSDVELRRIYLLSKFQGAGLGKALLSSAKTAARDEGAARLVLGVYEENSAALKFYAAQGFEDIGERPFQVGNKVCRDRILALRLA